MLRAGRRRVRGALADAPAAHLLAINPRQRVAPLIQITFVFSGIPTFMRGAFFRICADRTLRGPEGSIVARYTARGWQLGVRNCREFEAIGPVTLRAHSADGRREHLGPFDVVRAAEGALFDRSRCLGTFCTNRAASPTLPDWHEIALLDKDF
jgi:hypothetical protein